MALRFGSALLVVSTTLVASAASGGSAQAAVGTSTPGSASATPATPAQSTPKPAPPDAAALKPLLGKLGKYSERFELMQRRGSFLLQGRMEELNREGKVDGTKELVMRFKATPAERFTIVLKYLEDGEDKTAEAQRKADKARAEYKEDDEDPKKKFHLPFLPSEQSRYTFALVERDAQVAERVRVSFKPHEPAENAFVGSAWIDEPSGEVLTLGFSPTKTPLFVDHVDVQMMFDNKTSLGRAPSSLWFEARGSLLIFKKHFRGSATLTDAKIAF